MNAFICSTRHFVHAAQNIQLLFAAHALQRIDTGIERRVRHFTEGFHTAIASITHNGTCSLRTLLQCSQANLVGIGKTGFLTADGAHADALVNVIRTIFDDAVF